MAQNTGTKKSTAKKSKKAAPVDVEFVVDRDTKGTRRYAEVEVEGREVVIGSLYVKNYVWDQMPDSLSLTITPR